MLGWSWNIPKMKMKTDHLIPENALHIKTVPMRQTSGVAEFKPAEMYKIFINLVTVKKRPCLITSQSCQSSLSTTLHRMRSLFI